MVSPSIMLTGGVPQSVFRAGFATGSLTLQPPTSKAEKRNVYIVKVCFIIKSGKPPRYLIVKKLTHTQKLGGESCCFPQQIT